MERRPKTMSCSVEIAEWINQQKISRLQIMVLCVCAACALLEGFDAQNIGFVMPAVIGEWGPFRA
jgi:AAHS family 4-hydroxybenzoate transporter-like MFS transporter